MVVSICLILVFPFGCGTIASVKVGILRVEVLASALSNKKTKNQNLSMGVHNNG